MKNYFSRVIVFGAILCAISLPSSAFAQASITISPASGTYKVGEIFSVLINLNTGGSAVNVVSSDLRFDNAKLQVTDLGFSHSILSLWTESPSFSNPSGNIHFSGGVPSPGFTGKAGAILRVTFKAKAAGTATVAFNSASALANDGVGTNIADTLSGSTFIIEAAAPRTTEAVVPDVATSTSGSEQKIAAPIITEYSHQIEEGDVLYVKGLAFPNSKVTLYVQKGEEAPFASDVFTGPDGTFEYSFNQKTHNGFYRVWSINTTSEGVTSDSSVPVLTEVIRPLSLRIGAFVFSYAAIGLMLLCLVIILSVLLAWLWHYLFVLRRRRNKEVTEAEKILHQGFDALRTGIDEYVEYLGKAKTSENIKRRQTRVKSELTKGITEIERQIRKEIDDIKR